MKCGSEFRKLTLQTAWGLDRILGMVDTISIETLTEEEIERRMVRRVKQTVGTDLETYGSTEPNHSETGTACECTLCRNGLNLDKAGKSVCLRCNRASKKVEKALANVKKEETVLRALNAVRTVDLIKARATAQRIGRRGAKPNAERMQIIKATIKAELDKRGS